jgi:two-component system NarL family sensor kinase
LYKLDDPEAYYYQEESYKFKDSLRGREFKTMIEEITSKYNFESQKETLTREAEVRRLKTQQTFSIVSIFAVIVILSLLYWLKLNKLKLQETEYEKNQELAKIQSELQVKILNATLDGRETERKQIAETLHDSVSALLSSANLHLQATRKQISGNAPEEMDKTQQIIREATSKIRDLSHNLISSVLLKFGLNYALTELAEKYSNSELKITTEINDVRRYNQQFEIKINNIIQELVNNILKHSKASKATIKLEEKHKKLHISIEDNGVGFDKRKISHKDISGIGINQIEARVQVMSGKFRIVSAPNKGTKIFIEVPIVEKAFIDSDYPTL